MRLVQALGSAAGSGLPETFSVDIATAEQGRIALVRHFSTEHNNARIECRT